MDAALLLPLIRGALPRSDPRALATIDAVRAELGSDGFVYRYRHDDRPLHLAEGAFLLCGLWMALAAHAGGEPVAAAHWFERNRSACGPAALYTEEYDVHQRQLRGNLPQAFVHAGVLECAVTLSQRRAARDSRRGTAVGEVQVRLEDPDRDQAGVVAGVGDGVVEDPVGVGRDVGPAGTAAAVNSRSASLIESARRSISPSVNSSRVSPLRIGSSASSYSASGSSPSRTPPGSGSISAAPSRTSTGGRCPARAQRSTRVSGS